MYNNLQYSCSLARPPMRRSCIGGRSFSFRVLRPSPPVPARRLRCPTDRAPDSGGTSGGAGGDVVDVRSALHPTAVRAPSLVVPSCVDRAQAGGASHPEYSALHRLCPVHPQGKGQVATWSMWGQPCILRRCLSAAIRGGR